MDFNKLKDVAALAFQQYRHEKQRESGGTSYSNHRYQNQEPYGSSSNRYQVQDQYYSQGYRDDYNQVAHGPIQQTDYSYSDMHAGTHSNRQQNHHRVSFSDQYENSRPSNQDNSQHHSEPQHRHRKKRKHKRMQQHEASDAHGAPNVYANRYDDRYDNGYHSYNGEHESSPSSHRPGGMDLGTAAATFALSMLAKKNNHSDNHGGHYNDNYGGQYHQSSSQYHQGGGQHHQGGGHYKKGSGNYNQNGGNGHGRTDQQPSSGFDLGTVVSLASNLLNSKSKNKGPNHH